MKQDAVIEDLKRFIQKRFTIADDDPEFSDSVHLFEYGYVDSFGAIEVNAFVMSRYSVKITAADLVAYPLNSIREIAMFVSKRSQGEI